MSILAPCVHAVDSDGQGNYTSAEPTRTSSRAWPGAPSRCIIQGVENLFEVDNRARIMGHISEITGTTYKKTRRPTFSLRVITDTSASTTL
jgi:alanyl-tRNA synthetase